MGLLLIYFVMVFVIIYFVVISALIGLCTMSYFDDLFVGIDVMFGDGIFDCIDEIVLFGIDIGMFD